MTSPVPLSDARIIAIIRLPDATGVARVGLELVDAGVRAVEVTLTTPGALDAVSALRHATGAHCAVGVGSVRSRADVRSAAAAGAQFLVTPTTRVEVIEEAGRHGLPVAAGALSPTEIDTAWQAGAEVVKLFPASTGGPRYLREVRAPLPDVPLVPTGGVTLELVAEYAAAGAVGVGVGGALVSAALVASGDWTLLRRRADAFIRAAAGAWPAD